MPDPKTDEGFSLVEVIIAMFLLAVLALAVLPLMIGATRTSVVNRDLVAETAFANAQLAQAKALSGDCGDLQAFVASRQRFANPADPGMYVKIVADVCPATYPASLCIRVDVSDSPLPAGGTCRLSTPTPTPTPSRPAGNPTPSPQIRVSLPTRIMVTGS